MQSVYTFKKLAQLRRTGHVSRMSDERLPKKIFYGDLRGKMLPWWSEEAIQANPELIQHTSRVVRTEQNSEAS